MYIGGGVIALILIILLLIWLFYNGRARPRKRARCTSEGARRGRAPFSFGARKRAALAALFQLVPGAYGIGRRS